MRMVEPHEIGAVDAGTEMRRESTRQTRHFLNLAQVEEHLGLARGSLSSRIKLPEPDVIVGPVNADGSVPRGTVRGWTVQTIAAWQATRPGRGARTDLDRCLRAGVD